MTIVPANTASDYYDGWTYEGGEFRLAFVLPWAIGPRHDRRREPRRHRRRSHALKAAAADPTRWLDFRPFKDLPPMQPASPTVAPWYFDWIRHSTRDDFWRTVQHSRPLPERRVPVLDFEGWYDAFLAGRRRELRRHGRRGGTPDARDNQRLVIGPWDHVDWGRHRFRACPTAQGIGAVADSPINELMLAWFDHFLKGTEQRRRCRRTGHPRVDYFLMGANGGSRRPRGHLPQTRRTTYYLSGSGGMRDRTGALSRTPPAAEPPDLYTYDPPFPAPSLGRALVLRRAVRPAGTLRPDARRTAVRRPGLHQRLR